MESGATAVECGARRRCGIGEPGRAGDRRDRGSAGPGIGAGGTAGRERWEAGRAVPAGRAVAADALGPRLFVPLTARAALSEVLAAEAVTCLNRAMAALRNIWEEIGISEEQQLERTDTVVKHIKVRGTGSSVEPRTCCGGSRAARAELARGAGGTGGLCPLSIPTPVLQTLLDMMVAEEETLRERLLKNIARSRQEQDRLCKELQLSPFQVRWDPAVLLTAVLLPGLCLAVSRAQSLEGKYLFKAAFLGA